MIGHFVRFRERRSSPGLIIVSQDLDFGSEADEWVAQLGFVPL